MRKYYTLLFLTFVSSAHSGVLSPKIYASENEILEVKISPRGTALSFPTQPSKVVINSQFKKEIVATDLILMPLSASSTGTAFVYVMGSRYTLRLSTSHSAPALIVLRDVAEKRFQETISKKKIRGK